jgi:integrase
MRVMLKGIASSTKLLATGEKVTYYYAWRGGPRLSGAPDSPEFVESYEKAHRERRVPDSSLFKSIIASYLSSPDFGDLRERTKSDYRKQIDKIERAFGDMPIAALDDPAVTMEFREWRDSHSNSPRQADYAWTVLMLLLAWGRGRGLTTYRPPGRMKPLYRADRSEKIWEDHHIAAFMAVAPPSLKWALVLAADTGQRQGDLLILPWSAYDGKWIELKQAKTGRRVKVPVTSRLRAVLEAIPRTSPVILTNTRGRPWQPNSFRKAWGAATTKAGILGLHFHDLRGTAVTRLSEASCTPQEIARFTGHALRDVSAILDRYLARTDKLGLAALAKLERARK